MSQLLIHPSTNKQLERIITAPPHAILISGRAGSGKASLAKYLSSELLGITESKLIAHPYYTVVDPDDKTISIEQIRNLQNFLKLRVPSSQDSPVKRIACIFIAERMRTEAQNALLKTLEEPPKGTVIILTSNQPSRLLPTITSRVQGLEVLPVDQKTAKDYFSGTPPTEFLRAFALSGGQAELLQSLLGDKQHPLLEDVELAKQILSKSMGERLASVDELSKDREASYRLLDALLRIVRAGVQSSSRKQAIPAVRAWHKKQEAVLEAMEYMQTNAQIKLVLNNLFLNI